MQYLSDISMEYFDDLVESELQDSKDLIHQFETDRSEPHFLALWYDPSIKKFRDECGTIIFNPEALVPKYMIDIFKAQKSYFYGTMHGGNTIVELFWDETPDPPWGDSDISKAV